ncbi:MAG: 4'-phosphopantetheinyl transferase superfamily protein [Atopobiaceae bacterium]|nr:4'-phosphopantetheinyl transferase superfamily protein [Atopobiaceae bacterium]
MAELQQIQSDAIIDLSRESFDGLGCSDYGIVVLQGADSWGAHESGNIVLPTSEGPFTVPISYDEREAPFATGMDGSKHPELLLSLTDEGDYIACAWARVLPGSPLMGVGIDLNAFSHFRPRKSGRDVAKLLFTEHELELIPHVADDPLYAKAALFAAKEAAFKSCAWPLRAWYESHDDKLLFEVRHFCMTEPGVERGVARNGAAQAAMDRMGIQRIEVHSTQLLDMALVVALVLRQERSALAS